MISTTPLQPHHIQIFAQRLLRQARQSQLKAQLDAEGLFDTARKRPLPLQPRGIGLVTSAGAAALHDVVTALRRRVPHIPVVLVPAQVQGVAAPPSIIAALSKLYLLAHPEQGPGAHFNIRADGAGQTGQRLQRHAITVHGGQLVALSL